MEKELDKLNVKFSLMWTLLIMFLMFGSAANAQFGQHKSDMKRFYGNKSGYKAGVNQTGTPYVLFDGRWGGNMPKSVDTQTIAFFENGSSVCNKEKNVFRHKGSFYMSKTYAAIYYAFMVEWFSTYTGGTGFPKNKVLAKWDSRDNNKNLISRNTQILRDSNMVQIEMTKTNSGWQAMYWIIPKPGARNDNPFD